ncbi:MAG: inositol monophosphatase, partial [Holosporaceae bacterium]|nr:inositol monophosphatase [Holosporaceae bacterium]
MISVKLPLISSVMTIMTNAAVKASRGLLRDFSELENLQVSLKSNKNFVTNADLKSDKILKEELLRARPTYSLLSEETPEIVGEDISHRWIIDPLDGTVNYMHGFPHWAISIALEKDGEIVAAVTYDPVKNEMFQAEKGSGAFLNDRKIRVSGKRDLSGL